ncbi:MAG TPA: VWA domain-containing protein [Acidimicrobiales bacterium]|nr:VWA domain-containing protein [Acidimicrobiales bacterium]
MLGALAGFVGELRAAGLAVSTTEHLDAAAALASVPLEDRDTFRAALAATLVKSAGHRDAFETVFEVWFSASRGASAGDSQDAGAGSGAGRDHPDDLAELLDEALRSGDPALVSELARLAVARHADLRPERHLGAGSFERYRTLRHLNLEGAVARLSHQLMAGGDALDPLESRLAGEELEGRAEHLRREIDAEIRRRLVADRGAEAMASALRRPLPVDVELMHATRDELAQLRRCLHPLARALAARAARRRRHHRKGRLDVRATMRASLATGGVPVDPHFRRRHPAKPEVWVVADISGSVAAFARFTLALVHAVSGQFSAVRSFAFIDGVDEVTRFFAGGAHLDSAVRRINTEAEVVAGEGHSDYGAALEAFWARYGADVGPRTTVLVLGDARSNYHPARSEVVAELSRVSRHVYWLNPEPRAYWDSGDSVMGEYAPHCDGVFECRNLRQIARFVEVLA